MNKKSLIFGILAGGAIGALDLGIICSKIRQ